MAPRSQPFDESMASLHAAMMYAHQHGFHVVLQKIQGGVPGFQNYGPVIVDFLREGDTHLVVAGDDTIWPLDSIVRLVEHDVDVVSGIYRKNDISGLAPACHTENAGDFREKFDSATIHPTPFASAHSMTIKRRVIEKMIADYPELNYRVGNDTHTGIFIPMIEDGIAYQDDWAFSVRARRSGFTLYDDYGCRLKHFCSGFLGFEALEQAVEEFAHA